MPNANEEHKEPADQPGADPEGQEDQGEELLIALLAAGNTQSQAASLCHMSVRSIRRRRQDPEFKRRENRARVELAEQVSAAVVASARSALDALIELLEPDFEPGVRLAAARILLPEMRKVRALELEQRLADLEDRLDEEVARRDLDEA